MIAPVPVHCFSLLFVICEVHFRFQCSSYEKAVNQRTCFTCNENVESEQHIILKYPLYKDLRHTMCNEAFDINPGFNSLLSIFRFSDDHLRCDGWLNFEFSKWENIRDGPLKLFTRS